MIRTLPILMLGMTVYVATRPVVNVRPVPPQAALRTGFSVLPDIPRPSLSAAQAMSIAQAHLGSDRRRMTLVGVDWQKASDFKPVFSDAQYSPGGDDPDGFSWFVTYVYQDDATARELAALGIKRGFNAVRIVRVKDNGRIGVMIGFRT